MTAFRTASVAFAAVLLLGAPNLPAQPLPENLFVDKEDKSLKDPDNPTKKFRIDFARVEHMGRITREKRMQLTPENVAGLDQEEFDQLYGSLTAGPIPEGQYAGNLFFSKGDDVSGDGDGSTRLQEILGGLAGRAAGRGIEVLESLGRELWKGKVFFRDQRVLRNMIDDEPVIRGLTQLPHPPETRQVPRESRLGRRFGTETVWLLFPAKLYCGQSLVDGRRESIIVDYYYSDEIDSYRERPDSLAGRGGLRIRDEIRMIRPGFYLGRAYTNRAFLLNFTLFNEDVAKSDGPDFAGGKDIAEDCWPGEQGRKAAR